MHLEAAEGEGNLLGGVRHEGDAIKGTQKIYTRTKWPGSKFKRSPAPDHRSVFRNTELGKSRKYDKSDLKKCRIQIKLTKVNKVISYEVKRT